MSTSPPPAQSAKRPLEDPSSPSGPTDQPDAKRPALDKVLKSNEDEKQVPTEAPVVSSNGAEINNGAKEEEAVSEAPKVESNGTSAKGHNSGGGVHHDESGWIHIRACISSTEAATVIGKGGENVSTIRKMSGAKCTVSDYQKGAVERVLTVSGVVDAVAKVSNFYKLQSSKADMTF